MKSLLQLSLTVNGEAVETAVAPYKTLLEVLREDLDLTGTKHGCELGECGACAVLLDGQPVLSCLVVAAGCEGRRVATVEGMAGRDGKLHPLQDAFVRHGVPQCGFCIPGVLMAASALLAENPHPTEEEIRYGIAGNLCRCTGYTTMVAAIAETAAAAPARKG